MKYLLIPLLIYLHLFYINKILILPILYTNNAWFNQSFVKTAYAAILYYNWKDFYIKILHLPLDIVLSIVLLL